MFRPNVEYAQTRDGVTIAYADVGDGPLTTILVPGLIGQVDISWEEPAYEQFISRLTTFSRVLTFDRRGTGLSDPITAASGRLNLSDLTLDVEAVLDVVGVDRAVLLGVSLGAMTAVTFAESHPDRTQALVLIGASARVTRAPDFAIGLDPTTLGAVAERTARNWGSGAAIEADAPSVRSNEAYRVWAGRLERHAGTPSMIREAMLHAATYDIRDALPNVAAPTLILHRGNDLVAEIEQARYMVSRLADGTFIELPGREHTFFLGDQRILIEAVLRFLDQRVGGGALTQAARRSQRKGAHADGWYNLTVSEREVAILAAAGLPNREIATRLAKSPHTVDGHLRRVFGKLDVSTRVGVAAEYSRLHRPGATA